jgi:hypothetical protein
MAEMSVLDHVGLDVELSPPCQALLDEPKEQVDADGPVHVGRRERIPCATGAPTRATVAAGAVLRGGRRGAENVFMGADPFT